MDREIKAGALAKAFYLPIDGVRRERPAALSLEDTVALGFGMKRPESAHLVAAERVNARLAILDPADMQGRRSAELHLRPFQVADFRSPQAMPEGNQHRRRVPMPPATIPRRLNQLLDLGWRQVLARAQVRIGWPNWN